MPTYEYECDPCRVVFETQHGINDPPLRACPRCEGAVKRLMSAPNVNRGNFSSPTAARYSKVSIKEELAKERVLQRDYERIWLPPPVKHSPWEE